MSEPRNARKDTEVSGVGDHEIYEKHESGCV